MSFDLSIAGTAIPTDLAALKSFKADLNLAFDLDSIFTSLLGTSLANVPASQASSKVSYTSPSASWNLGGPVVFGLSGGASGALDIVTTGDLVDYTDGLDSPQQQSFSVPAGKAYVRLTLSFNISATAGATYSNGAYGAKAALDTSATYAIKFCKAFDPATILGTAIAQTFESFVLPLHAETLNQMSDGDYLLHDFDGNLHLSFGAYAGLDKVLYAGQSSIDVIRAFNSPLATLSAAVKPKIDASATLDFAYQYASSFEALLSKVGTVARLHLFHSTTSGSSLTFKAGLTFDANATASITAHTDVIQSSLVKAAAVAGPLAQAELTKVLTAATSEVDKYVGQVNDKLTSWLNRANGLNTNLQAAIQTTSSRTVLAGYDFDLASPSYPAAWQAAIGGDFVQALATGAVTLDVGSGLEKEYQAKTSLSFNFFNLWNFSTWNNFSSNVTLVYAGNNVFHLVANVGRASETDSMGARRTTNLYFNAAANAAQTGTVSNVDLSLHFDLSSTGDSGAASRIATLIDAVGGLSSRPLTRNLHAFASSSKTSTVDLHITFSKSSFPQIHSDDYSNGKPPANSAFLNDRNNWNQFVQAADDLQAWPLPSLVSGPNLLFMQSFQAWKDLNLTMNDSVNRLHTAYNIGKWPAQFPDIDSGQQQQVIYCLTSGQNFMNFCADIKALAAATDVTAVGLPWGDLVQQITTAIHRDTQIDFASVAALALIRICSSGGSTVAVTGPSTSATPASHFGVSLDL